MPDRLLTVPEVQDYLHLSRAKLYQLLRSGELGSVRIGTARRIPELLVWAVDDAVDELRPRQTERAERRAAQGSFLSRQMDFDGGMRCYGEFDPLSAAVINNAIDTKMGGRPPAGAGQAGRDPAYTDPDHDDRDGGHGDGDRHGDGDGDGDPRGDGGSGADGGGSDGAVGGWSSTLTGRAAARALVALCADALGGVAADGTPRPARPLVNVHVDLSQVSANPSGTIELNLRGPLPRIGAATLERLAGDADLRAVLFDRARPLATSRKVNLQDVCERTRIAVLARDRGCRFPGSPDPAGFTDVDHLHERERGGDHHPDNLACLSRRFHRIRHRHGWTLTLEPATGMLTIARGKRRFHSLPNGTQLARPPDTRPADTPTSRPTGSARAPARTRPALLGKGAARDPAPRPRAPSRERDTPTTHPPPRDPRREAAVPRRPRPSPCPGSAARWKRVRRHGDGREAGRAGGRAVSGSGCRRRSRAGP